MPIWRVPVEITSSVISGTGVNTWHIRTDGDGQGAQNEAEILLDDLETFYTAAGALLASGTRVRMRGTLRRVDGDTDQIITVPSWTYEKTGAGAALPPALAICPTLRSALPSRSGRGRFFLNPLSQATLQTNGTFVEGQRAALFNALAALISASEGFANGAFVVWSPTDGVGRDIVQATVPNEYAVLRSRRD